MTEDVCPLKQTSQSFFSVLRLSFSLPKAQHLRNETLKLSSCDHITSICGDKSSALFPFFPSIALPSYFRPSISPSVALGQQSESVSGKALLVVHALWDKWQQHPLQQIEGRPKI